MQIKIQTNFPNVQRQLETMRKDIAEKAVASALNKTVAQARTAMSREIRREFNITTQAVNDALRIRRATAVRARLQLEASLESRSKRGRSLNLINFLERSVSMAAARQRTKGGEGGTYQLGNRTVRKALQLRFKIRRTGPKKVIEGAFIGNKGRTVFIREGASRLPIKALQTINYLQGQLHGQRALILGLANLLLDATSFRAEGLKRLQSTRDVLVGCPVQETTLAGIDAVETWLLKVTG